LLDSLQGFAYADDKQVTELHLIRDDDKRNPRVEIEIRQTHKAGTLL
jgi:Holliday junction resolvase RusA-like endonuclease